MSHVKHCQTVVYRNTVQDLMKKQLMKNGIFVCFHLSTGSKDMCLSPYSVTFGWRECGLLSTVISTVCLSLEHIDNNTLVYGSWHFQGFGVEERLWQDSITCLLWIVWNFNSCPVLLLLNLFLMKCSSLPKIVSQLALFKCFIMRIVALLAAVHYW